MSRNILDDRHYMNLPICGYCMNAWDIIFKRPPWHNRPGAYEPEEWVNYCRVGGCDPDVWDFMEMKKPKTDDRVFHRRGSDAPSAPWRRNMQKLINRFAARRDAHYKNVVIDRVTGIRTRTVSDEDLDFGDDAAEDDQPAEAAVAADDDLEW